tara:strand:+ start:610 stop:1002 length:393 start_codon:yes stop_codon:yes gene_type:complete
MVVAMVVKRAPKKYRKSLTTAQREVAAQNLVKARAAKPASKNLSIHEEVRNLPDEHPISLKKVKEWLKICKEERSSLSPQLRKKYNKKMNDRFNILDVYIRNMEAYLKHGVWCDLFYGAKQEYKIKQVGV